MDELERLKNEYISAALDAAQTGEGARGLKAAMAFDAYAKAHAAAQESLTFNLWVNLYPNNCHAIHSTLESAKNAAGSSIIARHHLILTVRKGEGL